MTDPCDDISGPAAPTHHGHWPKPVHGMAPVHHLPLRIKAWLVAGCGSVGTLGVLGGAIRYMAHPPAPMIPQPELPMATVPEPGTLAMMILPVAAMLVSRWRMRCTREQNTK